jgi:hypothetical protein
MARHTLPAPLLAPLDQLIGNSRTRTAVPEPVSRLASMRASEIHAVTLSDLCVFIGSASASPVSTALLPSVIW